MSNIATFNYIPVGNFVFLYSYVGLPEGNGRNWDLRSYLDALLMSWDIRFLKS